MTCPLCDGLSMDSFLIPERFAVLMREDGRCYSCAYWARVMAGVTRDPWRHAVVDGIHYIIAEEGSHSGSHRGHRGRPFALTDLVSGCTTVTNNLWNNGRIPNEIRSAMPDTHTMENLHEEDRQKCIDARFAE